MNVYSHAKGLTQGSANLYLAFIISIRSPREAEYPIIRVADIRIIYTPKSIYLLIPSRPVNICTARLNRKSRTKQAEVYGIGGRSG